ERAVGGGEQLSGSGPPESHPLRISCEDSGAGGGPGPSSAGGERRGHRRQQAPACRATTLLESLLLPGQHYLRTKLKHEKFQLFSICMFQLVISLIFLTSGTRGGGFCTISQRFLSAHTWTGFGGSPLCSPARCHGRPGHSTPPAGALRPTTLPADCSLSESQPPLFTCSPGAGQQCSPATPVKKMLKDSYNFKWNWGLNKCFVSLTDVVHEKIFPDFLLF
ncbi:hypothetical protein XENOCAPTIV_007496, partial [Xenoophorus captivus]